MHLALGVDKTSMNVAWATQNASVAPAAVRWGVAGFTPTPLQPKESTAQGDTRAFTYDASRTRRTGIRLGATTVGPKGSSL